MRAAPGYALITGASRGIGAAFAAALAAEGHSLILTARSGDELERVRAGVVRPGIDVRCFAADLAGAGAGDLVSAIRAHGLRVDMLINNAGFGSGGSFDQLPGERELDIVKVNVCALVALTHAFLPEMSERGHGVVINVASTAAFQPVPYMATYAGTKAFVLNFSQALHEEMRTRGVQVMALCPGPTRTGFFQAAGIRPLRGGMQSSEAVVAAALRGVRARRAVVVSGAGNRVLVAAERLLPRQWVARAAARVTRGWMKAE